jgi:hypothetical protein
MVSDFKGCGRRRCSPGEVEVDHRMLVSIAGSQTEVLTG